MLINGSDRQIRVYDSKDIVAGGVRIHQAPKLKIQETINHPKWKSCSFSSDGEYIFASCSRLNALYIWDKTFGNITKILHNRKGDYLMDVIWHPTLSILASIGSGCITIWTPIKTNNDWTNYLSNFVEIENNIEYEERESEYDIDDEDESFQKICERGEYLDDEDFEIDVETLDPIPIYYSSDEDDGSGDIIYKMPVNVIGFDVDLE